MKWKKLWQNVNFVKNFDKNLTEILFMIYENINSIEIVVEKKKLFMTNEKNIFFFMIDSEDDEWLNIDSNNSLNKIVDDECKWFKKTSVAISSSSLTFMKLIYNVKLLSSSTALKQIVYLEIENRFTEVERWKIKNRKNKSRSNLYSF